MKSADSEEINQKRLKDTRKRGANENSSDLSASDDPFFDRSSSLSLQTYLESLLRKFGGSFCVNDDDAVWMVL